MPTIAAVPGSFDPLTFGHLYLFEQALKVADMVHVYVSCNASKPGLFNFAQRVDIIKEAAREKFGVEETKRIDFFVLPRNEFTAARAAGFGAQFLIRGLRNTIDFEYERDQAMFNAEIEPNITTMFFMPPAKLTAVSSSALKGMVGIQGWEDEAVKYLPEASIKALKATEGKTRVA